MLTQFSYPIICTDKVGETASYYEDHFDFVPAFEIMHGFVILQREGWDNAYLAILSVDSDEIPEEYRKPTSGMILNYPVENVEKTYDDLYLEGLDIVTETKISICGRKHFFVKDPNGILIDVAANVPLEQAMAEDELDMLSMPLKV